MNLHELAAEGAEKQAQSEAEAFERVMSRIKPKPDILRIAAETIQRLGSAPRTVHQDRGGVIMDSRIKAIADHYGFTSQADMLIEEAAEFTIAVNKLRRGDPNAYENIKEEIADVIVVAKQLRYILGAEEIDKIISSKLDRQIRRIADEKV